MNQVIVRWPVQNLYHVSCFVNNVWYKVSLGGFHAFTQQALMDMVKSNPQMPLKVANLLCMTQKIMTHQHMSELSSRTVSFSLLHLSKRIHFFQLPESRHRVGDWCVGNSKISAW